MSKRQALVYWCALGALGLILSVPAYADRLTVTCEDTQASRAGKMSLVYEGEASGTLNVKGAFGEMTIPATKAERTDEYEGRKLKAVGISAFGAATVAMPDRRALEACIAERTKPRTARDADLYTLNLLACRERIPEGTPAAVKARVDISIDEPPLANVFVSRTYQERSNVPGGTIAIESVPPPACHLSSSN
jgi:hypothetical protein